MTDYLIAFAVIFAINLLPAFGPPTWSILVLLTINANLAAPVIVVGGALAAASGRLVLASGARRFRPRLSPERRANLESAQALIGRKRRWAVGGLALFALSPLPSAQLFIAAGLLNVPLVPVTAAFFAGRLVSYSLYVGAAATAEATLGEAVTDSLTSPVGVALQVAMLIGLVALVQIDWSRLIAKRAKGRGAPRDQPPVTRV